MKNVHPECRKYLYSAIITNQMITHKNEQTLEQTTWKKVKWMANKHMQCV